MGDLVLVFLMGGLEGMEAELRKVLGALLAARDEGVKVAKTISDLYEHFARNEVRHLVMHASRHAHYDFSHIPHLRVTFVDPGGTLNPARLPPYATTVVNLDGLPKASDPPPPPSARPDSQPHALRPDAPRKLWRVLLLAKADTQRHQDGWIAQETVASRAGVGAVANHVAALKALGMHVQSRAGMMRIGRRPVTHELASKARSWNQATFTSDDDLIVHRTDADDRKHWGKDWDFSIALTLGKVALKPDPRGRFKYSVSVELKGELGIFRNRAKEFLRHHFLSTANRVKLAEQSQLLHMAALSAVRNDLEHEVAGKPAGIADFPFRWASGGSLLLVTWRGRRWAMVFFRDIRPVGWNLANGASESVEEQAKILQLIERETMEEVVLLSGDPSGRKPCDVITLELERDLANVEERQELAARLLSRHHELRQNEDGLSLRASNRYAEVSPIRGPGAIDLIERGNEKRAEHGLFVTVDPLDFGIEAIRIGTLQLPDDAYPLDGEVIEGSEQRGERDRLARRPVGLLALSYLERCWKKGARRTLGDVVHTDKDDPRLGGKELPEMTISRDLDTTDLFVFDHDYRWRLDHVAEDGPYADGWLQKFGPDFKQLLEDQLASVQLRTLCPVTWKVLEQALACNDWAELSSSPTTA